MMYKKCCLCYINGMSLDLLNLPENAPITKQQVLVSIRLIEEKYQSQIDYLEEQLRLLRNELFGRKSEKHAVPDHNQLPLFTQSDNQPVADVHDEPILVSSHKRKKRGRKPLPEHLPRVDVIHDIRDDEKMCACGHLMIRIGQDQCEKLDYIPAKIQVVRHIRYKYACKHCEGVESDEPTVKIAPLIPKSNATAGLLADI